MRFINKIYSNIDCSSLSKIRNKLIVSTYFCVLLLITINLLIFYISTKDNYVNEIESSNENLINQIGFSYEMILKNVKNSVYKTTLIDTDLIELIQNYDNSFDHHKDIFDKLYSVTLLNEYIQSAYLYMPSYNQVFSTSNNTEKISSYESFSDKRAFSMIYEKGHYTLEPRIVKYNKFEKQILSVVSSVPLYSQQNFGFLVVNVDLDKLRYNILVKFKKNQNINFYVLDNNNSIIITDNSDIDLGTILEDKLTNKISYTGLMSKILHDQIIITSVYDSKSLQWKFVLENYFDASAQSSMTYMKKFLWYITVSVFLLLLTLVIFVIVITIFTKPINKILIKYKEKIWKDFITDSIHPTEEIREQLIDDQFDINAGKYGIIVLHIEQNKSIEEIANHCKSQLDSIVNFFNEANNIKAKILSTTRDSFTIIISYIDASSFEFCEEQQMDFAQKIYDRIETMHRAKVYLGISTIKEGIDKIPSLYRECMEVLKYKLTYSSHLLNFAMIKDRKKFYRYPYDLEKQLLNNVSTGNIESCKQILDEFFLLFNKPNTKVEDNIIKRNISNLGEAIINNIKTLPIPIEYASKVDMSNLYTIDGMKTSLIEFIEELCSEISEIRKEKKSKQYDEVLGYIEKNYTQSDISLNKIADTMNINRNYVSKIIKETTGKSFTDYINDKRISLAKELLKKKNTTIKDIAEEVGYNYSYYFIKIFKSIEGVTPGQYRNSISSL